MQLVDYYVARLKSFEGFRPEAYTPKGEKASKYLTIGYGTRLPREKALYLSPMNEEEADYYLRQRLNLIEKAVRDMLADVVYPLSDEQYTALVDMAYNCGVSALANSTLMRIVREINYDRSELLNRPRNEYVGAQVQRVCIEFQRWTRSGGVVLPGLVNRCSWRSSLWSQRAVDALHKYTI